MTNDMIKLSQDVYNGIDVTFSNGETGKDLIENMVKKAFGGIDMTDKKAVRDAIIYNKVDFSIINEVISIAMNTIPVDESPLWEFVEYKNGAEGDKPDFSIEGDGYFRVDVVTEGTQGIRRQRILDKKVTVTPVKRAIKVYEELARLGAGRINWTSFVNKVGASIKKDELSSITKAFKTVFPTSGNGEFVKTGTLTKANLIELLQSVEDAGYQPRIFASLKQLDAIGALDNERISDAAKNDIYNFGYVGKFLGVDCFKVSGKDVANDKIYILGTTDKFIKLYNEGEALVIPRDSVDNGDLTQELTTFVKYGATVVTSGVNAVYNVQ